jgi:glucan phosphoethanolaminetransferase (alkaline phosphatase superfamily)
MLDIFNWVTLGVLFLILLLALWARFGRNEPRSPHKELRSLRYSLIIFAVVAAYVYLSAPHFHYYSDVPEIQSLEEARNVLTEQDASLKELNENINRFERNIMFLLFIFCSCVLPPIYNFAKALVPIDKNISSIFNYDE